MERVSAHCCYILYIVFKVFGVQFQWTWTKTVQGHPGSKVIVPIESLLVVSYLTSIVSNIVYSRPCSRYLMQNSCDLDLGRFKVIQSQRSWCQSIAHGWFPVRLPLTSSSYLSPFSKYLTCNFNDLELGGVKVIQDKTVMEPIESPWVVSFESNIVSLTVYEIFDGKISWPRSRTVQGHPKSKIMVPVDSP